MSGPRAAPSIPNPAAPVLRLEGVVGVLGVLSLIVMLGVVRLGWVSAEEGRRLAAAAEAHSAALTARIAVWRAAAATAHDAVDAALARAADALAMLSGEPEAPVAALETALEDLRRGVAETAPGTVPAETITAVLEERLDALAEAAAGVEEWVRERHRRQQVRSRALGHFILALWALGVSVAALALAVRERRRAAAEASLEQGRYRLHQAQKMEAVGRLAGGLAHDINNYLATIRAHCELVLGKLEAGKDVPRETLEAKMRLVVGTVLKASSLVERLLTFSRRQVTRPEVVDLGEVVETFETMMRGSVGRGIRVETRLAPDLWPVEVDLSQIEQVLANLFVNARDAVGEGGRIVIETRNCAPGEAPGRGAEGDRPADSPRWVRLSVSDDGAGIPVEIREQIFEPFFTTKEEIGSSGLGLATVYGIVEEAGGCIEVESEVGEGTTVHVFLPRVEEAEQGVEQGVEEAAGKAAAGGSLLLVDDNADLRGAAASLLASRGFTVVEAGDAEGAVAAAREAEAAAVPFDLVITDVRLGSTSGPDLVARLRAGHPGWDLKALYMSGYTDRIALRAGPGQGDAFFLKKPFSAEGLVRMVHQLLATR